uniref:Odorant Binding Protein 37 n=1 Tax=Dendrolimus punctatus TaxID=238572 RepID=A0A2K8GKN5_9NEOP|nr:Odorant Binding Protein 37 [Dendrolimus punctatus]
MKRRYKRRERVTVTDDMGTFTNLVTDIIILLFTIAIFSVYSFKPLTKEEQIESYNKMKDNIEPFRKNLTECARQVKASMMDVETFIKNLPQKSNQGKCLVACILKRNAIIRKNKIDEKHLLEINRQVYKDDSEVMARLRSAIAECTKAVEEIFEICEYASVFNDCMYLRTEHILEKVTLERRMETLGQMSSDPDQWSDEEDEMLKLVKDEL